MTTKQAIWHPAARFIGLLFLIGLWLPWSGIAQPGRGWGANSPYYRLFDPTTIDTLQGTIVRIERFRPQRGAAEGIHVILRTGAETMPIHLGPVWYLENQETQLREEDAIQVIGSRITFNGRPALIALRVERSGEWLLLRDQQGFPTWRAWRRARPRVSG